MIYRVGSSEELFTEWRNYEQDTSKILLSSLVQNDMLLSHEQLNNNFDTVYATINSLQDKYSQSFLIKLHDLMRRTADYIKELNNVPITQEEFLDFMQFACPHFIGQWEDREDIMSRPVLVFCNHNQNPDKHEGNCAMGICPLMKNTL